LKVEWAHINVITTGQTISDYNKQIIKLYYQTVSGILAAFDQINQMITLTAITISGLHCIYYLDGHFIDKQNDSKQNAVMFLIITSKKTQPQN